jgi:hypothetical protein
VLSGALVALLCSTGSASAAWNNVFQVTFFHHKKPVQSNYVAVPVVTAAPATAVFSSPVVTVPAFSAPCGAPCGDPCQKCTTNYVQRCFYQPVTVMTTKTFFEPVTTMQTSYYYEPVVSVKYSCFFDPCSCSVQKVAVPFTSYCLKAKSCPVQSWVEKCCQVPVTTYQKSFYWEPHTTCCTTTVGPPIFPTAGGVGVPPSAVPMAAPPSGPPPASGPPPSGPPPVYDGKVPMPGGPPTGGPPTGGPPPSSEKYYGPPTDKYGGPPPVSEGSQMKSYGYPYNVAPSLGTPMPAGKPAQPPAAPKTPVPLDKLASLPGVAPIKGQVVSSSNAPRPHTQLVFVPASLKGGQKTATANAAGQFSVSLASGQWNVYIHDGSGQPKYHSKIHIAESQPSYLTLVSN